MGQESWDMSFIDKISGYGNRLRAGVQGTVGLTLAVSVIPLFMAAGSAIDYMNASRTQAALQSALDSAALAAGYDPDMSTGDMVLLAKKYLKKNKVYDVLKSLDELKVSKVDDTTFRFVANGKIDTMFMKIAGYNTLNIGAETEIRNNYGNLELAMVLDNTWSMSTGGKMRALKRAANTLVDKLHDNKSEASKLKIGLVPFAQYVNVGMSRRNASWLYVPDDQEVEHTEEGYWERKVVRKYNCRKETKTGYRDGIPYNYEEEVCDKEYGKREWHEGETWTATEVWHGCVGSRNYPLNTKDKSPGVKIQGLIDEEKKCPRKITTLTKSKSVIKREIRKMTADGDHTYIPAGLMWGWRLISSAVPITDGVSKDKMKSENYTKAVVLMTDGENTISPSYAEHEKEDDGRLADRLTKEICNNIKNDGKGKKAIRVYTVTFDVSDAATKDMMRSCATNSSYYFDASDSQALADAFEEIGKSLITLYLSK